MLIGKRLEELTWFIHAEKFLYTVSLLTLSLLPAEIRQSVTFPAYQILYTNRTTDSEVTKFWVATTMLGILVLAGILSLWANLFHRQDRLDAIRAMGWGTTLLLLIMGYAFLFQAGLAIPFYLVIVAYCFVGFMRQVQVMTLYPDRLFSSLLIIISTTLLLFGRGSILLLLYALESSWHFLRKHSQHS